MDKRDLIYILVSIIVITVGACVNDSKLKTRDDRQLDSFARAEEKLRDSVKKDSSAKLSDYRQGTLE